jgi:two-component system chemotaxis response regulator CheY
MTDSIVEPARVLVVDDAPTVRMYHTKLLSEGGYHVAEAANGLEAVETAMTIPFDLFVVDVNMPTMDGYACVERLRGDTVGTDAPIVIISTENRAVDMERAYRAGANLYLVKPLSGDRLRRIAAILTAGHAAGHQGLQ